VKGTLIRTLLLAVALAGCAAGEAERSESLDKHEGAITGCAAKSVTTVVTVVYDYDLAGRQTRDRDARLVYDPWNQLKEVQLNTTTNPKYNDGRTVVAEKHTYGFDGTRTSTTTNPGAANAAVRVQITPDDLIHDGKREHYVRIGDRIVARLAMTASGTLALNDAPPAGAGGGRLPAGLHFPSPALSPLSPWPVLGLAAALVLAAIALLSARRRRPWAPPSLAGVALLAASCQMFGEGVVGNGGSLLLAEKVYFHKSLGAGPSLITRQDGTILEERRFEPFGVPINAFRSGRTGTAPVDLVTDPQSVVGKQADATNAFTDHGARWLSSQSARWLTPDPATTIVDRKILMRPWDLNPYQYSRQNPVRYWDPSGNFPVENLGTKIVQQLGPLKTNLATHEYITKVAVGDKFSPKALDEVIRGNVAQDEDQATNPISEAKHGMRSVGQDPADAIARNTDMVDQHLGLATNAILGGKRFGDAREEFGAALHNTQDTFAPAHRDSDGTPKTWECVFPLCTDAVGNPADSVMHIWSDIHQSINAPPAKSAIRSSSDLLQNLYTRVYEQGLDLGMDVGEINDRWDSFTDQSNE
jgi:RHS repeat-associated protein